MPRGVGLTCAVVTASLAFVGVPASAQDAGVAVPRPGVSVIGQASTTIDATEAYVVLLDDEFFSESRAFTEDEQAAVVEALAPFGITSADVELRDGDASVGEPSSARVELAIDEVAQSAEAVASVVEGVLGPFAVSGLAFESDACARRHDDLRRPAVVDARHSARRLGSLAHREVGPVVSIVDTATLLAPFELDPCATSSASLLGPYGSDPAPFGSKPVIDISRSLAVTFELEGASDGGLTAVGRGRARGIATAAEVVVGFEGFGGGFVDEGGVDGAFEELPSATDRAALVTEALEAAGFTRATSTSNLTTRATRSVRRSESPSIPRR